MIFLKFVFYLGVIYILFDLLWTLFVWGLKNLLGIDRSEGVLYYVTKGLSLYLLVALTAVNTMNYQQIPDMLPWQKSVFAVIGLVVLYFYITSMMQKSRLKAKIQMDVATIRKMRYDGIFLLGALVFYLISLYIPHLNETSLTGWLFGLIEQVYDWFLVRVVVGFFAIIFLLNILVRSVLATRMLLFSIFGMPTQPESRYARTLLDERHRSETVDAEYEEVDREDDGSRPQG